MKLSLITINYNNAAGLEKTLKSVVSQKGVDFEFIVIDGGSTDGSLDLIKQFADKITFWVSEKDNGIYAAQNKGILKASGDYCLFLNSGDFLCHDGVLEEVFSYGLEKDIVYGNMRINWGNNNISDGFMPDIITVEHMVADTLWHPVSFIKRSLFHKYGLYNEAYKMVADYDFFFKTIIVNKVQTKHIPLFISEYNTEGISSDPGKKSLETGEREKVLNSYLNKKEIEEIRKKIARKKSPFKRFLDRLKR